MSGAISWMNIGAYCMPGKSWISVLPIQMDDPWMLL